MPVIAGHRAEEFHLVQFTPGRASADAVCVRAGDRVEPDIQRGIAEDHHVVRRHLGHLAHQALRLRYAEKHAVIPAVGARCVVKIAVGIQHVHQSVRQIQLFLGRLAAGHIQLQSQLLHGPELLLERLLLFQKFLFCPFSVRLHTVSPSRCRSIGRTALIRSQCTYLTTYGNHLSNGRDMQHSDSRHIILE